MMKSSLLIALTVSVLCYSSLVSAENYACNYQGKLGYYDLSPLSNTQISGSSSDAKWFYFLQMCGVAPGTSQYQCNVNPYSVGAMACQVYYQYSTQNTFAIGYPDDKSGLPTHQWTEVTNGIQLTAYAAAAATAGCPSNQRAAQITITCDPTATAIPTTLSSYVTEPSTCVYGLAFTHASGCPGASGGGGSGDSSDGGISGGTVFLIVLLVGAFVYVAGGCFYKRYKVGTTGMIESCPNNEFWTSIPGLVKDGCLYTVRKLKSLCGGGGSSSGSTGTYESI